MSWSSFKNTHVFFGPKGTLSLNELLNTKGRILVLYDADPTNLNSFCNTFEKKLSPNTQFEIIDFGIKPGLSFFEYILSIIEGEKIETVIAVGDEYVATFAKYLASAVTHGNDGYIKQPSYGLIFVHQKKDKIRLCQPEIPQKLMLRESVSERKQIEPEFVVMDAESLRSLSRQNIAQGLLALFSYILNQYLSYKEGGDEACNRAFDIMKCLISLAESFNNQDDLWRTNFLWVINRAFGKNLNTRFAKNWVLKLFQNDRFPPKETKLSHSFDVIEQKIQCKQFEQIAEKLESMGRIVFGLTGKVNLVEDTICAIKKVYELNNYESSNAYQNYSQSSQISDIRSLLRLHGMEQFGGQCSMTIKQGEMILEQVMALKKLRHA